MNDQPIVGQSDAGRRPGQARPQSVDGSEGGGGKQTIDVEGEASDLAERCAALLIEIEELQAVSQAATRAQHRLKSHLGYRIGQALANHSRPLWRMLLLPAALVRIRRSFLAEQGAAPAETSLVPRARPWTRTGVFLSVEPIEVEVATLGSASLALSGCLEAYFGDLDNAAIVTTGCRDSGHGAALAEAGWARCADRPDAWFQVLKAGAKHPFRIWIPVADRNARVKLAFARQKAGRPVRLTLEECRFDDEPAGLVGPAGESDSGHAVTQAGDRGQPAGEGTERLSVASILDEISAECLANGLRLHALDRNDWQRQLSASRVEWLLVESAWDGNGGSWEGELANLQLRSASDLKALLHHCRGAGIPTVFWNKDDPPHFLLFLSAAAEFDYVFTADSRSVTKYKALLGHDRVLTLPFAADPSIHNPISTDERLDRYCFAGSWRASRYPIRANRLETLLEPALQRGILDIFDRNASSADVSLRFPPKYQDAVRAALPYRALVSHAYRRYRAFLNVNSVEDSPTMIARRVYELVACGTPVISSPSAAIEETFDGIVYPAATSHDVERAMAEIEGEPLRRDRRTLRGIRLIHGGHTYAHRLEVISRALGKPALLRRKREVTLICVARGRSRSSQIADCASRQTWAPKGGIYLGRAGGTDMEEADRLLRPLGFTRFLQVSNEADVADCLNDALEHVSTDLVAKIDGGDLYGPNYLEDAVRILACSQAGVVGKGSYFRWQTDRQVLSLCAPGREYKRVSRVHGSTLLWDRKRTGDVVFRADSRGPEEALLDDLDRRGVSIISSDYFNFVHVVESDRVTGTGDSPGAEDKAVTIGNRINEGIVFV